MILAFQIVDGELIKYINNERGVTSITIPEGVTRIGENAFLCATALESITLPNSVKSIGSHAFSTCWSLREIKFGVGLETIESFAFSDCIRLEKVEIPNSVSIIGLGAFQKCIRLAQIDLPSQLKSLGDYCFGDCPALADKNGFVIFNGTLYGYYGNCAEVVVPDGVKHISDWLLIHAEITHLQLPKSAVEVAYNVFPYWENLSSIIAPGISFATFREKIHKKAAIIGFLSASEQFTNPLIFEEYLSYYNRQKKKLLPDIFQKDLPKAMEFYIGSKRGAAAAVAIIDDLLPQANQAGAKRCIEWLENWKSENISEKDIEKKKAADKRTEEKAKQYAERECSNAERLLDHLGGEAAFRALKVPIKYFEKVHLKDSHEYAEEALLKCLILANTNQYQQSKDFVCQRDAAVDEMAGLLDPDSFQLFLTNLYKKIGLVKAKIALFFLRYANSTLFVTVKNDCTDRWEKKACYNAVYLLNDSREAIYAAAKKHTLKQYAFIRGISEDELIDNLFGNFGFDDNGRKYYDLGGATIRVVLSDELKPIIFDDKTGKALRNLPTKNIVPEKRNAALNDLKDLRKNIARYVQIKAQQLLDDYLSGIKIDAVRWVQNYQNNVVLASMTKLLVWQQGDATFTLKEGKLIDCKENCISLSDQPVCVAHPIEMTQSEIEAWQHYFSANQLKQLFEQVWETVYSPDQIRWDRYRDAIVPTANFRPLRKHGIKLNLYNSWYSPDKQDELIVEDCSLSFSKEQIPGKEYVNDPYERYDIELWSFSFKKYTRRVNHAVYLLDALTIPELVRKDDISVMKRIHGASLPQVLEYLRIARDNNALNLVAALLDYKHSHFGEELNFEEFTIEW